ncbi:hypothetical protein AB0C34_10520 [Nocardia sp. NPDC049220]|uniref:hypothetical protein n=1 Tax=Nocardia sp. NPDC049220 TaxID=3155273 RepID=UPI00340E5D10
MPNNNDPIGISQSHFDGTLSIIGADGWPLSPEETAELLDDTSADQSPKLLQRVHDALRLPERKADDTQ